MANSQSWLVLGAGSWLGYLLLEQEAGSRTELMGSIHQQKPTGLPPQVALRSVRTVEDNMRLVKDFQPGVVFNFLRGEDEEGYALHTAMADFCRSHGALYVYVSSALALDGYENMELTEDLPPKGKSPYGIFKARCETYLKEKGSDWLVVRFASAQGWIPHKSTRNEKFLSRIFRGEKVTVDIGVRQNRLAADWLVEAIRALARDRVTGIVHLGATDASEEIDFLQREAAAFGWNPQLIVPGPPRSVNLVCRPGKIFQLYGTRFQRTETDTLNFLARHPGLQRWRNSAKS